jgi:tungstate transport system substrate-binding protein
MMRKILSIAVVAVLLVTLLAACGQAESTPEPPAPTEPAQQTAEEPTAQPTPVPTEEPTAEPTAAPTEEAAEADRLILATTTSTENSGLLAYLLPDFESQYNVSIDVVAVGTGQALQLGRDGNADVLLVHARAQEDEFMAAGDGVRREDVMYNDFVILGPPDDPAGIRGKGQASKAFELIAEAEAPFISRGDESGTHTKEKAIWAEAGIEPAGDWYIAAGQGMGAVLTMADEQAAYTLSDRATYLARTLEGTSLEIMVEGDPILFNPYGVIAVNPDKGEHIKADLANTFIDWLVSLDTQAKIAEFGVAEFGAPLFTPDSAAWREAHAAAGGEAGGDVALRITGMVTTPLAWSEEEVRAMETMDVESTNKSGEVSTYTGVPINALLDMAGIQDGATAVVYLADDGYTAEATLDEVRSCSDCIVSFRNQGGFSIVMPGFAGSLQVKGVIEIQVK